MNLRVLRFVPLLAVAGCVTTPPVSSSVQVDPAARPQCEQHCSVLGMKMTAVVIYSNRTGCVCEPLDGPGARAGAAVAAAGEVVNEEEASAQQQSTQQAQSANKPVSGGARH